MSLRFEFVPAGERGRWEESLRGLRHGYWHGWDACHAIEVGEGVRTRLCVAREHGRVVAAAPMAEREWRGARDLFTPVGFSGFAAAGELPADFHAQWSAFAAAEGYVAGYFALHPEVGVASAHGGLRSDNDLFVLDLDADTESLRQHFDRSVRRALKEAEEDGIGFVTDRARLTAFVLEHYAPRMDELDARVRWSAATLAAMFEDPALLVAGVEDAQGLCAMHSFGVAGQGAEFHLHLAIRDGRRHTTALIWWGLRALCAAGLRWANLGGGIARGDAVARAKLKFRPRSLPFLRACEIYRPEEYRRLCAQAGVQAGASGFHPAYLRP